MTYSKIEEVLWSSVEKQVDSLAKEVIKKHLKFLKAELEANITEEYLAERIRDYVEYSDDFAEVFRDACSKHLNSKVDEVVSTIFGVTK